jgi:hypothetical protein
MPLPQYVGLLIDGLPIRTDFQPIDASGQKFALKLYCPGDLPTPISRISEIVLFLMPNVPIPPGYGVMAYWQITAAITTTSPTGQQSQQEPPSTGFELLGSLTPSRPSGVFTTGWSDHEQLLEVSSSGQAVYVTIGVAFEPLGNIQNIQERSGDNSNNNNMTNRRLFVAQKIAMDLFVFMKSFDTGEGGGSGNNSNMVVPKNIFDRWFQRFEARFRRDPNFFLRDKDS